MNLVKIGSPLEIFTRHMFTEVIRGLSAFLAGNDFSVSEIAALHLIDREGGITAGAVAGQLGLSVSATSRLVARLERKDLIHRNPGENDSRKKPLSCTDKGKKFLNELSLERARAAFLVLSTLPPKALSQMLQMIQQIKEGYHEAQAGS